MSKKHLQYLSRSKRNRYIGPGGLGQRRRALRRAYRILFREKMRRPDHVEITHLEKNLARRALMAV